ncbi:hypothetical protein DFH06DRAFT_184985 [Mycena polygramma]|nr:hypothetical protein DFH06DRAFT_184985 [Mycena polygramma]
MHAWTAIECQSVPTKAPAHKMRQLVPQHSFGLYPMSPDSLQTPALEALLAFHLEAARQLEERLRSAEPPRSVEERVRTTSSPNEHDDDGGGSSEDTPDMQLPAQSSSLQSPFTPTHLVRRTSVPSPGSPSSTPVRSAPRISSPPSVRVTWPRDTDATSPTPALCRSRKRRRVEEEESSERNRVRVRIVPGWPRGFIRTPPRRRRLWDKENEQREGVL